MKACSGFRPWICGIGHGIESVLLHTTSTRSGGLGAADGGAGAGAHGTPEGPPPAVALVAPSAALAEGEAVRVSAAGAVDLAAAAACLQQVLVAAVSSAAVSSAALGAPAPLSPAPRLSA